MDQLSKRLMDIRSSDLSEEIIIEGKVVKVFQNKMKLTLGIFRCIRCNAIIEQIQNSETQIVKPFECYRDQGGCIRKKSSTKFLLLPEQSKYTDFQEIVLQDFDNNNFKIKCVLEDENVGKLTIGDECTLRGIVTSSSTKKRSNYKLLVNEINILPHPDTIAQDDDYFSDKMNTIKEIIYKLAEVNVPVDHNDILIQAKKEDIDTNVAEEIIKALHREEGYIYEPRPGSKVYMLVESEIE